MSVGGPKAAPRRAVNGGGTPTICGAGGTPTICGARGGAVTGGAVVNGDSGGMDGAAEAAGGGATNPGGGGGIVSIEVELFDKCDTPPIEKSVELLLLFIA